MQFCTYTHTHTHTHTHIHVSQPHSICTYIQRTRTYAVYIYNQHHMTICLLRFATIMSCWWILSHCTSLAYQRDLWDQPAPQRVCAGELWPLSDHSASRSCGASFESDSDRWSSTCSSMPQYSSQVSMGATSACTCVCVHVHVNTCVWGQEIQVGR